MKPIRMKQNLIVADKIRRAISRLNKSSILMQKCWFECFDNCREQGYVLKVFTGRNSFNIAFSECRNSDEIVVYCYTNTMFHSNLPDGDDAERIYFSCDEIDEATKYILRRAGEQLAETFYR